MRADWMPYSASSLVAGATALSVGSILLPATDRAGDLLQIAEEQGGRWMAVSSFYFFASVALVLGMPSLLALFEGRGRRTGLVAIGVFTVGCVGIAGFAMVLALLRALVVKATLTPAELDAATGETGFALLLYAWVVAFYLGEVLLAVALLRAGTTGRWLPALLLLHVATWPLGLVLPDSVQSLSALLVTVALAGIGITANNRSAPSL